MTSVIILINKVFEKHLIFKQTLLFSQAGMIFKHAILINYIL